MVLCYWPNPAHKNETTEVGPPVWRPNKAKCPAMTIDERRTLLAASVAENEADPHSRRFAMRRTASAIEFFEAKWTRDVDADAEFHGYPTLVVPGTVLRKLRDAGSISQAEYERVRKELG